MDLTAWFGPQGVFSTGDAAHIFGSGSVQGPAHLREVKDGDGEPWPEWTGEQPYDHPDNEARETARKELERDITIPDYTEIVGATGVIS
jgi:hypothetical protein